MTWLRNPAHARWLESEGDRLLEFGRASRDPAGGFGWLDDHGRLESDRAPQLLVTARMTHVHALADLMGRPGAGSLAAHGIEALQGLFRDPEHDGWFAEAGPGASTDKTAYEHAFVVLAASSAVAASVPGGRELLEDALAVFLTHFWDDEHGMVVEKWDRSWTTLDPYRGVNANMHSVEALLAAADVLDDSSPRDRAARIATRVVRDLAPAHEWRIPEHFDAEWNPRLEYNADDPAHPFRPYGATIGHWMEWGRLVLDLRAALGDEAPEWMLTHPQALFDAAVREGWAVDGADGFVYTVGWDGRPVVRERMHWVVAEATATAAALYAVTGEASYDEWYSTWWSHIQDCFVDLEGGSWWHELSPANEPSSQTWEGKPDLYHAFQATLLPRMPLSPTLATALRDGLLA